jgi:hypothetical protein
MCKYDSTEDLVAHHINFVVQLNPGENNKILQMEVPQELYLFSTDV